MKHRATTLFVAILVLACGVLLLIRRPAPPAPTVTLPDGSRITLVAVTCGTNHVVGPLLGRLAARLPVKIRDFLVQQGGERFSFTSMQTPVWQMRIWYSVSALPGITAAPGQSYTTHLAGTDGFVSGEEAHMWATGSPNSVGFSAWPQRSCEIELRICKHAENIRGPEHVGSLRFQNPAFKPYPQWVPESLPVTKTVNGLDVTLDKFSTGHGNNRSVGQDLKGRVGIEYSPRLPDGPNNSAFEVRFRSPGNTNESWTVSKARLSDATGNSVASTGSNQSLLGDRQVFSFSPSLWPDESAWRLEVEAKRTKGFADSELVVFKGVPLPAIGQTNSHLLRQSVGGIQITLDRVVRRAPLKDRSSYGSDQLSRVDIRHSPLPTGIHCDFVTVVTDTEVALQNESLTSSDTEAGYRTGNIPADARFVDVTLAVHRGQTVSFLVKPELPHSPNVEAVNDRRN
jgi:hypothetical protein